MNNAFKVAALATALAVPSLSVAQEQKVVLPGASPEQKVNLAPSNTPQPMRMVATDEDIKKYATMKPSEAAQVTTQSEQVAGTAAAATGSYAVTRALSFGRMIGSTATNALKGVNTKAGAANFLTHQLAQYSNNGPLIFVLGSQEDATYLASTLPNRKVNIAYLDPNDADKNAKLLLDAVSNSPTLLKSPKATDKSDVFIIEQRKAPELGGALSYADLKAHPETLPNIFPLPTTETAPGLGKKVATPQ